MNIRRQPIRFVERPNPHEADRIARTRIVAPERHPAHSAANDLLAFATVARRVDTLNLACQMLQATRLNHRVQSKRGSGLPLAPSAVTAVNEQGNSAHAITNRAASAPP